MLAVKYDDFASSHYVKDGRPTDQRYRAAIEPLVQLFGDTLASDFGPKDSKPSASTSSAAAIFAPRSLTRKETSRSLVSRSAVITSTI